MEGLNEEEQAVVENARMRREPAPIEGPDLNRTAGVRRLDEADSERRRFGDMHQQRCSGEGWRRRT